MDFWKHNTERIKQNHSYLLPVEKKNFINQFDVALSRSECPVPRVLREGKTQALHSLYYPEKENNFSVVNSFPIMIGMGGLYHIRSLLEQNREMILIEPHRDLFLFLLQSMDLSILLENPNCRIVLPEAKQTLDQILTQWYSPYLMGWPALSIHQSSSRLFPELYSWVITETERLLSNWKGELQTQKQFCRHWFRNSLQNLSGAGKGSIDRKGDSLVILAAGSSLESCLDGLETPASSTSILAVDSVLPLLTEMEIPVDFVFTLDSQIVSYHHYLKGMPPHKVRVQDVSAAPVLSRNWGKHCFLTGNSHPLVQYLSPELPLLNTGLGNVTSVALDFAIKLGFREIEIRGADFSFPTGKPYCRDSYIYNHFLYGSNRCSSLEDSMVTFSLKGSRLTAEGWRSTPKMEFYKRGLEDWLNSLKDCRWKQSDRGHYNIRVEPRNEMIEHYNLTGMTQKIQDYFSSLKEMPLKDHFSNYSQEEQRRISTLFPLMACYLENNSWKISLKKALNYTLGYSEEWIYLSKTTEA